MQDSNGQPPAQPALTVLLVSYNTKSLLAPCFEALEAALAGIDSHAIVVVDNASADGSAAYLRENFPQAELIALDRNVGFGRANNAALARNDSPYLLLLNTDAFVSKDAISRSMAYMAGHPECGVLGARLVGRDGVLQPSCRFFPTPLNSFISRAGLEKWFPRIRMIDDMAWDHASVRDCDWVPGCFYLIRREVVERVGLFDPRYFLYFEEVDHCFAVKRAGWKVVFFPDVSVVHLGGESAKSDGPVTSGARQLESLQIESSLLYFRKNHGLAGLVSFVVLDVLADVILSVRKLLRRSGIPAGAAARRIGLTLRLLARTDAGTRPTR